MRQGQSKRSRGRRKQSNSANRSMESNGPDVKIRGNASHIYEKYQQLARDAQSSGDRIAAENYLQHAEHYYRLLMAAQAEQQARQQAHEDRRTSQQEGDDEREGAQKPNGRQAAEQAEDGDGQGQRRGRGRGRGRRRDGEDAESGAEAAAEGAEKESGGERPKKQRAARKPKGSDGEADEAASETASA